MKTPENTKRDMAKCAKRVSEVIECFCEAGELVGCAQDAKYELIGGISCIQQLEQDNAQKDERIRKLEREKVNLLNLCEQFGQCVICKHTAKGTNESPCCDCRYCAVDSVDSYWEWRGVEEDAE